MKSKSFIIYDNDLKSINMLPVDLAGRFMLALADYRLNDIEPDFSDCLALNILFNQIKYHLDSNEEKYKELCKRNAKIAKNRWAKQQEEKAPDGNDTT